MKENCKNDREDGVFSQRLWCRREVVGVGGFEPPASWPQTRRSSLAELHPVGFRLVPARQCSQQDLRPPRRRRSRVNAVEERDCGSVAEARYLLLAMISVQTVRTRKALRGATIRKYSAKPCPASEPRSRRAAKK